MNRCRLALKMIACAAGLALSVGVAASKESGIDHGKAHRPVSRVVVASAPASRPIREEEKPYFIEFRARAAESYGHTFAVHGKVGEPITAASVVGLHPFTESPIPWMVGHLIPVPSETGASDGDTEDYYIIARYRILLTEAEYNRVTARMREMQAHTPLWHAVLYNCNAFVADIAHFMGLKTPFSTLLMPKDFINELKELNTGTTDAE